MAIDERIQQCVHMLPPPLQAEVLTFVEYLVARAEREALRQEEMQWRSLSLAQAMRGMEGEETPVYTTSDLKVVFV